MFPWNFKDEIGQNYKITKIKCVLHEILWTTLINILNIRDEMYNFSGHDRWKNKASVVDVISSHPVTVC